MIDLDLVGRCAGFRVTGSDGYSRKEFFCYAGDEERARQYVSSIGYVPVHVEPISTQEMPVDGELLLGREGELVRDYVELYAGYCGVCPPR